MKIKLLMGGVFAVSSATCALAASGSWNGSVSSDWRVNGNWSGATYPGGGLVNGDTATISNSANNPVSLAGSLARTISTATINADTANASVELDISGSASASFTTTIALVADPSAAYDATFKVTGYSSLSIANMDFTGAASDSNGHAIADIQASTTVTTSTDVAGFVDFVVANGVTFDVGALMLSNAGSGSSLSISGGNSSSQVNVDSYTGNSQPLSLVGPIVLQHN